jgi:hypothetical protein
MTLQEQLITELLDPRSALSPREVAAAEEIKWLRSQIPGVKESWNAPIPLQKAEQGAKGKREVS